MNEKLNTVFDIINATNTVSANRYLSHALGAEVAIIYNALPCKVCILQQARYDTG